VNVLFGDGAVRFISETIDNGNLMWPGTTTAVLANDSPGPHDSGNRSGASPFGVWGALGTPSAGDSASL